MELSDRAKVIWFFIFLAALGIWFVNWEKDRFPDPKPTPTVSVTAS